MAVKWIKTQFPCVRYYEHETRRGRNGQPDKYFAIRHCVNGKRTEEGLGWASEGWSAEKAYKTLGEIKASIKTGSGPQSLAERRHIRAASEKARAEQQATEDNANMTLEVFFRDIYIPRAKREKRSWRTDEQRIAKEIVPALGYIPIKAVRKEDVQKFIDNLADAGAAPATVKQYMGIIRRGYNIAIETSLNNVPLFVGQNPTKNLRLPAVHNSRERYLTKEECEAVICGACKLHSPDLHDSILLSLNTGLRLGELMRLRWLDVDISGGIITVPDESQRKTGGKVPMNKTALAVLLCRKEILCGSSMMVFPPVAGGAYRNNMSEMFRKVVDEAGLNDGISDKRHRIVFHSLRHTFASWLALAGTDLYRIKTLMRHKSINMTMRYAHLIPDATRDAVQSLKAPKEI